MSFLTRPLKGMAMAQIKPFLDKFIKGDSLDADTVQVDTTGITVNNVVSAERPLTLGPAVPVRPSSAPPSVGQRGSGTVLHATLGGACFRGQPRQCLKSVAVTQRYEWDRDLHRELARPRGCRLRAGPASGRMGADDASPQIVEWGFGFISSGTREAPVRWYLENS